MGSHLSVIGFDADDTLWHNERFFRMTEDRFAELLSDHAPAPDLRAALLAAERRNLGHYGFGIKGFLLSMIETAIEVTEARVPARVIARILDLGQEMLRHPVELLPHVEQVLGDLSATHPLVLITKGDLLHQEQKLAASGLGEMFAGVEIVSDKTPQTYARAFSAHGAGAERALMVGDSMRSDILPALAAGAWAAHVPQGPAWALEAADPPRGHPRFRAMTDLAELPDLVAAITG